MENTTSDAEPILIVGSGAMACFFAARLATQRPVLMMANWPAGVAALQRNGIQEQINDGWRRHPVSVITDPTGIPSTRYALVLVKSWQTNRAGQQLAECLSSEGIALTLQNGLGNYEKLSAILGEERVALGVTTYGATLLGPGQVRPAGDGVVELAMVSALADLRRWLDQAGFTVKEAVDLAGLVWGKLAVNAGINPITAITRATNGLVAEHLEARQLMEQSVREVVAVAQAEGVDLPQSDPVAATLEVARRTAENRSSMLQDLERGAPTEIDAICGEIVRHGQRHGVATPLNQTWLRLIRAAAAAGEYL